MKRALKGVIAAGMRLLPVCALVLSFLATPELVSSDEHGQIQDISFENPFFQTRLKDTIDTCMQLWGDLQVLCGSNKTDLSQTDYALALDVSIGRAAFINYSIRELIRDKFDRGGVVGDGLPHIAYLVDQVNQLCDRAPKDLTKNIRFSCMRSFLSQAQRAVSITGALFQGNDTVIGSSE